MIPGITASSLRVGAGEFDVMEDFEEALGTDWDLPGAERSDDRVFEGGFSLTFTSPNGGGVWRPDELLNGTLTELQFYYNEDSASQGAGIYLYDDEDNPMCGFATNNPQWMVGEGPTSEWREVYGGDGEDQWHRVRMFNIDWDTGTFDWEWENLDTESFETGSGTIDNPVIPRAVAVIKVNPDQGWFNNASSAEDDHFTDNIQLKITPD